MLLIGQVVGREVSWVGRGGPDGQTAWTVWWRTVSTT